MLKTPVALNHSEGQIGKRPFVLIALIGFCLRLASINWSPSGDLEAWNLAADLVLDGKNVYASTERYNYGPPWFLLLAALKWIAGDNGFRLALCLLLSLGDMAIAALLRRRGYARAAVLFLAAPWSIFITGRHHMFDNLAILLGLLAVCWVEERKHQRGGTMSSLSYGETLAGCALLGASLMLKHVLFLFPLWMVFRVRSTPKRLMWLTIPYALFAGSFVPYWTEGAAGISAHVFHYVSTSSAPFFNMAAPNILDLVLGYNRHPRLARLFFAGSLLLAGMFVRRASLFEDYLCYLAMLLLFSSGTFNHYYVIPVLFTVVYRNVWGLVYNLLAVFFYVPSPFDFSLAALVPPEWRWLSGLREAWGDYLMIVVLGGAVAQALCGAWIRQSWRMVWAHLTDSVRGQD